MYSLGNAAPIQNIAYNDVPIQNQYSNPQRSGPVHQISNYQFNNQIAGQINNDNENYEIYASQSYPSPSLFIEQDTSMSGYGYANNMNQYTDANNQKKQFNRKQIPQNAPPYLLENFVNSEQSMNQLISPQDFQETNRLDRNKEHRSNTQGLQRQHDGRITHNVPQIQNGGRRTHHVPQRQNITYNNYHQPPNYLNVDSMPNIAGLYNQPIVVPVQPQMQQIQPVVIQDDVNVREVDDDERTINDDDDNDDDDDDKSTKIKELKKKIKKKKDKYNINKKKKDTDKMIYFTIFLLLIIICLMLYIIIGVGKKRVRF